MQVCDMDKNYTPLSPLKKLRINWEQSSIAMEADSGLKFN